MRDPDASKPFTRAEVRAILPVADAMVYTRRDRSTDPFFFGRMVRVFLTFGPHPSRVSSWSSRENLRVRPTERGDRTYFIWVRAKPTETTRPNIETEVPQDYVPWLGHWLDERKPICAEAYWVAFRRIEQEVARATPYRIHLNPLRARHTCAVELLAAGFTIADVQAALGISLRTVSIYGVSTPEQRGAKAEKVGWGSWT